MPAVVSRVGVSRFHVSFEQHSYTLVLTVVSRFGVSQMTYFHTTFLHAGARSGDACRNISNDFLSSDILAPPGSGVFGCLKDTDFCMGTLQENWQVIQQYAKRCRKTEWKRQQP